MALLPGSPAIDKGSNANLTSPAYPPAGYPFLPPMTSDQRIFIARIINGGMSATVDIGAYEYAAAKDLKYEAIADITPCLSSADCNTRTNARSAIRSIQCSLSERLWKPNDRTRLGRCGELVCESRMRVSAGSWGLPATPCPENEKGGWSNLQPP